MSYKTAIVLTIIASGRYVQRKCCGARTLETAAPLPVILFNDGYVKPKAVLERMGCGACVFTVRALANLNTNTSCFQVRKSFTHQVPCHNEKGATKKGFAGAAKRKKGIAYNGGEYNNSELKNNNLRRLQNLMHNLY